MEERVKKAFFYGDSNTFGYDPADYYVGRYDRAQRWTYLLEKALQGEWEIVEDGMPGRVIPAAGAYREYWGRRVEAELPIDLFGIMLGTNDLLGTRNPSAAKTAREMDGAITLIQGLGIPEILLIAPPKIELTDVSFEASYVAGDRSCAQIYRDESRELTRLYRELAERKGIRFADASSWDLDFAFDAIHLSEKGNEIFAGEMAKVMRAID